MTPIPIPKTIDDPRLPEICRRVFVELCGGKIDENNFAIIDGEKYYFGITQLLSKWNPFLNIQDTEMCYGFIIENRIHLEIRLIGCDCEVKVYFGKELLFYERVNIERWAFVVMVAIIKVFNKLQEEK